MSDNFFDSRPNNNDNLDNEKWKTDNEQKTQTDRKKMLSSQGEPNGNDEKHPLFQSFSFWFVKKVQGGTTKNRFDAYEQGIQCLTTFSTVPLFFSFTIFSLQHILSLGGRLLGQL